MESSLTGPVQRVRVSYSQSRRSSDSERTAVRIFGLIRLADVLLNNYDRRLDIWQVFISHIQYLLTTSSQPIRTTALAEYARVITELLKLSPEERAPGKCMAFSFPFFSFWWHKVSLPTCFFFPHSFFPHSLLLNTVAESDGKPLDFEVYLLSSMSKLRKPSQGLCLESAGLARVAMGLLQRYGESLQAGWRPLLEFLREIAHEV